jgi:type VI secretion system protein ImpH
MAAESGRAATTLRERLFKQPAGFPFFQAVRMLHKLRPRRTAVGYDADPKDEALRFRSDVSFVFPPGDIRVIYEGEAGEPDEVVVNFMGIASPGSFGSLPVPYAEEIRRQEREFKNPAMRDFFDLFNHRLISLFYRAWERTRIEVLRDLARPSGFEAALRAVIGLEGDALKSRLPFDEQDLLARSGLLGMTPAPAVAIEGLVESLLDVPVRVEQFVATWYEMGESDRTRLGAANSTLGDDFNLGSSIRLVQPVFRLRLGPMDFERYQSLLPGTQGFRVLSSVVRLAAGVELDFQLRPVLKAEEVPATRLGGEGPAPSRLGRTTWLGSQAFDSDADQAIFEPSLALEEPRETLEGRT